MSGQNYWEEFKVTGSQLLAKVEEIIREGNARRIIIRDKAGRDMLVIPLTLGVVGAVLAPVLAAVGALAAMVTDCTVAVERVA